MWRMLKPWLVLAVLAGCVFDGRPNNDGSVCQGPYFPLERALEPGICCVFEHVDGREYPHLVTLVPSKPGMVAPTVLYTDGTDIATANLGTYYSDDETECGWQPCTIDYCGATPNFPRCDDNPCITLLPEGCDTDFPDGFPTCMCVLTPGATEGPWCVPGL